MLKGITVVIITFIGIIIVEGAGTFLSDKILKINPHEKESVKTVIMCLIVSAFSLVIFYLLSLIIE